MRCPRAEMAIRGIQPTLVRTVRQVGVTAQAEPKPVELAATAKVDMQERLNRTGVLLALEALPGVAEAM